MPTNDMFLIWVPLTFAYDKETWGKDPNCHWDPNEKPRLFFLQEWCEVILNDGLADRGFILQQAKGRKKKKIADWLQMKNQQKDFSNVWDDLH